MNLFKNPLKTFEEENEKSFFKIKSETVREEVQKLVEYISTSSVSVYQVQIIRKDLIEMALEAEQDNISLKEKLGREPMEFCDDVISSVGKSSAGENLLRIVVCTLNFWALYYAVGFFILWNMPKQWGIMLADILVNLSAFVVCGVVMKSINHKMYFKKNAGFYAILVSIFSLGAYGTHLIRETEVGKIFLVRGNGWVILFLSLAVAAGITIVWNRYWERVMRNTQS